MRIKTKILQAFIISIIYISQAYAVELKIKNDLSKYDDGTILEIENAISVEAAGNKISFRMNRGETKAITSGNVRSFILTRVFPLHKLKYDIICPKDAKGEFLITLVQVHEGELPGGCKVARAGHWSKLSGTNWETRDAEAWKILQNERHGMNLR